MIKSGLQSFPRPKSAGAAGSSPTNPNTILLMHFDGTNGSTSFPDVYGHTTTPTATTISTAQSQFGGASGIFNGTTSKIVVTPNASEFNFGQSTDFTLEWWFRYTAAGNPPNFPCMLGNNTATFSAGACAINVNTTSNPNKVQVGLFDFASTPMLVSTTTLSTNTWHAVAFVRHGTAWYLFVDGNLEATVANFTGNCNMQNNGSMIIGTDGWDGANGFYTGYIDELRISKTAYYTSNYTPSGPFIN